VISWSSSSMAACSYTSTTDLYLSFLKGKVQQPTRPFLGTITGLLILLLHKASISVDEFIHTENPLQFLRYPDRLVL
jgi:hypothetical protein